MKQVLILSSLGLSLLFGTVSFAKTVELTDAKALSFFNRHGDELENVDGTHQYRGVFHYVNKKGQTRRGYADCWIQTMADAVSCTVIY